jgi:hypothetical protein
MWDLRLLQWWLWRIWDIPPCSLVEVQWPFGGMYGLQHRAEDKSSNASSKQHIQGRLQGHAALTDHNLLNLTFYPTAQSVKVVFDTAPWTPKKNILLSFQELWYNVMDMKQITAKCPSPDRPTNPIPTPFFLMMLPEVANNFHPHEPYQSWYKSKSL